MDGGLLSDERLIEASRKFVCIRLLTYESSEEAEFLGSLGETARGGVRNTSFVLLAPDGTHLSESGRSPRMALGGTEDDEGVANLLDAMSRIAEEYPGNAAAEAGTPPVPYLVDVRRALNTAACDLQPLVVVSVDSARRGDVEAALAQAAWSDDLRGRFAFVSAGDPAELSEIEGAPTGDAVFVVRPGTYGLTGTQVATTTELSASALRDALERGLDLGRPSAKGMRELRAGMRQGVGWEEEDLSSRGR
ncbi:hypothetical protein OAX78_02260 [Planctomycetota bacterium]|nr:hypothetical protein [Planctomycetota bacterium]